MHLSVAVFSEAWLVFSKNEIETRPFIYVWVGFGLPRHGGWIVRTNVRIEPCRSAV